jgi:hypothetical protein
MLTVTPEAEKWITTQLKEANAPEGVALRLFDKEGQIHMGVAEPKDEDATFDSDGRTYLAVGPDAATRLEGKALCCQETAQGESLAIATAPPE